MKRAPLGKRMSDAELPQAADFPDRNILIYDGECRFCIGQVTKLATWDSGDLLAFLPLQDPLVAERFPDLTREMLMKEMLLVTAAGDRFGGVNAVREMSRMLPRLKWLAFWFRVPFAVSISRLVYRTIARFRYRIWGKVNRCDHGTCEVHF
jgi:predicted DCC family thiol-disulfide oxidoreductase YuxK